VKQAQASVAGGLALPAGYRIEWGGQFENFLSARRRLAVVVPMALALIVFMLWMTFRELKPAILIFLNVPFAVVGGIFALWIRGLPFSISAGVGFIALFGVAVLMVSCSSPFAATSSLMVSRRQTRSEGPQSFACARS
jgi:heavy metal efflux system protein